MRSFKSLIAAFAVVAAAIAIRWALDQPKVEASSIQQPPIYLTATRTLTPAEIKALDTTPIEVIAAPGAGYAILPGPTQSMNLAFATTPYTIDTPGQFRATWDGADIAMYSFVQQNESGFFDASESQLAYVSLSWALGNSTPYGVIENKAIVVSVDQPLTDGDSPVTLVFSYYVQKLR